jgi:predicted XRE-type DNA-binding protein
MKKRVVEDIEIETSIGNAFADPGLPDADKLAIKSSLAIEIAKAIRKQGLTQREAAKRVGLTQPKVSVLLRGELSHVSERKLMNCLIRLGYNIEIRVHATKAAVGQLTLSYA